MNMPKTLLGLLVAMALYGCASQEPQGPKYDLSLYDGRPVDSLTSEALPASETEAISRGDTALRSNNNDLALYEYIRALSFPDAKYQDKTLYNIGRIHESRGNIALADKAYTMALEYNPNSVKALEQLGAIYSKQGRADEGKSYFLRALNADQVRLKNSKTMTGKLSTVQEINPLKVDNASPATAYLGLGVLSDVDAQHSLAEAYYLKALEIKPNSVKGMLNLGYSYYMSGQYDKAERYTLAALEKDPENKKGQNNLALIYLGKDEIPRATNIFMRSMGAPEALNNVGYFLILQGKPDKAIPYLQEAIDKKPSYYKLANENLERALALVREQKAKSPSKIVTAPSKP
ncbi:tetratricopeptide repeat protein [Vibrio mimicus]|uniref:tetratricopeptide repeat protein n=1 Tax=Vibrio mimicus TaxID=674 RepID=UPI002FF24C20